MPVVSLLLCLPLAAHCQPRVGTLLQYDLTRIDGTTAGLQDSSDWRRTRLSIASGRAGSIASRLEYDFEAGAWTDVYIRAPLAGGGHLTLGQFKQPFSADSMLSDSQAFFTESSTVGVFAPGRRLGVQYGREGLALALHGRDLAGEGPDLGMAARGYRSRESGDARWHLGLSIAADRTGSGMHRLRLRPQAGPATGTWLSTSTFESGGSRRGGVEAAWQQGRLLLIGEMFGTRHDSEDLRSDITDGGYLSAGWTLRGDPRAYEKGLFVDSRPEAGGTGRIELVGRVDRVDLPHDGDADSGGQRSFSVGVNAQAVGGWRVQFNHHISRRATDGEYARLWTLRLQWSR